MAPGRPTKYNEDYCSQVIQHLSKGKSLASFAAKIGTHRQVLWSWRKKHDEFNDACNTALELSLDWWENFSEKIATGEILGDEYNGKYEKMNVGMVMYIMKQRFYRDYNRGPTQDIEEVVETKVVYKTSMTNDGRMVQDIISDIKKEEESQNTD